MSAHEWNYNNSQLQLMESWNLFIRQYKRHLSIKIYLMGNNTLYFGKTSCNKFVVFVVKVER